MHLCTCVGCENDGTESEGTVAEDDESDDDADDVDADVDLSTDADINEGDNIDDRFLIA